MGRNDGPENVKLEPSFKAVHSLGYRRVAVARGFTSVITAIPRTGGVTAFTSVDVPAITGIGATAASLGDEKALLVGGVVGLQAPRGIGSQREADEDHRSAQEQDQG